MSFVATRGIRQGPEIDGTGLAVELDEFALRVDEAAAQVVDYAEPALAFGLGDRGSMRSSDIDEPCPLCRRHSAGPTTFP